MWKVLNAVFKLIFILFWLGLLYSCSDTIYSPNNFDASLDTDDNLSNDIDILDGGIEPDIWCNTQWPISTKTAVGNPTENLYTRVKIPGVTPSEGTDNNIEVEVGFGFAHKPPQDSSWQWFPCVLNYLCDGCNSEDEYMGNIISSEAGEYIWASRVRFNLGSWVYCDRSDNSRKGSDDGWSVENAPTLSIRKNFSVISLNLRCLLDNWDARLPLIADVLASANPDFIGLQEVCREPNGRDNLLELVQALEEKTGKTYQISRADTHWSWDAYNEGIAIITPYSVESSREAELPAGAFVRKVVMTKVITFGGRTILFATTHLDHLDSNIRINQINSLLASIETFKGNSDTIVITGDFNESPSDGVHSIMKNANYTDMWETIYPDLNGYTFPASNPSTRIDYIWLNQGAFPESVTLILNTVVNSVTGSDHFGLWGIFSM